MHMYLCPLRRGKRALVLSHLVEIHAHMTLDPRDKTILSTGHSLRMNYASFQGPTIRSPYSRGDCHVSVQNMQ